MEVPFKGNQVYEVVKALIIDKASSLDGCTMTFSRFFPDFHSKGQFVRSIYKTFIALTLKKVWAINNKDFY